MTMHLFSSHTNYYFVLKNLYSFTKISFSRSNHPKWSPVPIEEVEANNMSVISGVDPDTLNIFKCILWNHMTSTASWPLQISLVSPCSIGEDEVKGMSITVFLVVLKANKGVNQSTLILDHSLSREFKLSHTLFVDAFRFCSPDINNAIDLVHPLGNSLVKETVDLLEVDNLLVSAPKLRDKYVALRVGNHAAKLSCSGCICILKFVSHNSKILIL